MWFTHKVEVNSGGGELGDNNGDTDFEKGSGVSDGMFHLSWIVITCVCCSFTLCT